MKIRNQLVKYGPKLKLAAVVVPSMLLTASVFAGTYMPDVSADISGVAAEAKTMGTDAFSSIFPVVAFFVGLVLAIKLFRKLVSKIG